MKIKKKIIIALIIVIAFINIPLNYVSETHIVTSYKNHIVVGQREHDCSFGFSLSSLSWTYSESCISENDGHHQIRKELIFFNTIGFEIGGYECVE